MKKIDLSVWERSLHYQVFRDSVQPQYCVSFDLDITNFLSQIRLKGFSFTFSFVFAVSKCANYRRRYYYGVENPGDLY